MLLVPFVPEKLREETKVWAAEHDAWLCSVAESDDAYWRLLVEHWADPGDGDLVVVEHDILPAPGVVEAMVGCPRPWCSSPYPIAPRLVLLRGLGCVRFSAQLRHALPDAVTDAGVSQGDGDRDPPGVWWGLDTRLSAVLGRAGYQPHAHLASEHLKAELMAGPLVPKLRTSLNRGQR